MIHKDSYITTRYRGGYIHTCWNRDEHRQEVTYNLPDKLPQMAKSIHAAKIMLARAGYVSEMDLTDIEHVRAVLSEEVASCVPDGELEPPSGATCRTRSGFRAWLKRAEREMARKGAAK